MLLQNSFREALTVSLSASQQTLHGDMQASNSGFPGREQLAHLSGREINRHACCSRRTSGRGRSRPTRLLPRTRRGRGARAPPPRTRRGRGARAPPPRNYRDRVARAPSSSPSTTPRDAPVLLDVDDIGSDDIGSGLLGSNFADIGSGVTLDPTRLDPMIGDVG